MSLLDATQVIVFANQLKDMLLAHEKAATQLSLLDSYISDLTRKIVHSQLDGCHGNALRLLTKKSIARGIMKAYQHYKQRKFQHIQELSLLIIQQLQGDDETISNSASEIPHSLSSDNDDLASAVTDTFLTSSRSL